MVRGHVHFAAIVNRSDLSLKLAVKVDIFTNNTTCKPFLLYKAWYLLIYIYDFLFIAISKDLLIAIQTLHPTTGCLIRQAKIYQPGLPGLSLLLFKSIANFLYISRNHHLRVTAFFFIFSSFFPLIPFSPLYPSVAATPNRPADSPGSKLAENIWVWRLIFCIALVEDFYIEFCTSTAFYFFFFFNRKLFGERHKRALLHK